MTQWVYRFGKDKTEGRSDMYELLGGKGANLAEMASIGLPVPPGFTITTDVCTHFYQAGETYPEGLETAVTKALHEVEDAMGMGFGDSENPLLLSVRSGARSSMPGMMDTVLNLGMNDETVEGLAKRSGDERFAWDSYRRFIHMYSDVVLGIPGHHFEDMLDQHKMIAGVESDTDVDAAMWKKVVASYKDMLETRFHQIFPQDHYAQLWGAVGAVFKSWMVPRAITYRKINNIPESWGTAVNVQAMVFGNMGEDCATGVAFTRDPSTGENMFYGEYLVNAQGEDVVAGVRTPQSLTIAAREKQGSDLPSMEESMPAVFKQLDDVRQTLETHYRDMQDIEFTVQENTLFMLQTRMGKRTAQAALRIAVEMEQEGLITRDEALLRIHPDSLDMLLHPMLDPKAERDVLAEGLPASPGGASGVVVFTADEAVSKAEEGVKVILCRHETSPEDIHGMHAAEGIMTSRGGMTSHAAVVARGMGVPCVAGAESITIDYEMQVMRVDGREVNAGDMITIDGSSGQIMAGRIPTTKPELSGDFGMLMGWADETRRMKVRTNAETPDDAQTARDFGAEGIGLCRTEHMFFDPERIQRVREMIFAEDEKGRRRPLNHIAPMQRQDFVDLFTIMKGLPVTVRLLDPPLHEFLPHSDREIRTFADDSGIPIETVKARLARLEEANPMLGHRGCRLGITYPEIYEMQARAICEAAIEVAKATGEAVIPEIMIPLVGSLREFELMKEVVDAAAKSCMKERGKTFVYQIGTMIELPRAALRAGDIAQQAEFFSFGTNDLTQTTLGISRDDSGSFMPEYVRKGVYKRDPFERLDVVGVGELIEIAVERGQKSRPDIKLGICGEHGGEFKSIAFCEKVGLDYVSCSPYRVPIARLAAAQAALRLRKANTVKLEDRKAG